MALWEQNGSFSSGKEDLVPSPKGIRVSWRRIMRKKVERCQPLPSARTGGDLPIRSRATHHSHSSVCCLY